MLLKLSTTSTHKHFPALPNTSKPNTQLQGQERGLLNELFLRVSLRAGSRSALAITPRFHRVIGLCAWTADWNRKVQEASGDENQAARLHLSEMSGAASSLEAQRDFNLWPYAMYRSALPQSSPFRFRRVPGRRLRYVDVLPRPCMQQTFRFGGSPIRSCFCQTAKLWWCPCVCPSLAFHLNSPVHQ